MKYNFDSQADDTFFERYLGILGVEKREPSLDALEELVYAHLTGIPFENISKLFFFKKEGRIYFPEPRRYLDGIEKYHFGGTCYTNNYYLNLLLRHLGYNIKLCGADMNQPDVHVVSIVTINGREFLVDIGYAAPFYGPIPRDSDRDYEIKLGKMRYVVKTPDAMGRTKVERYYDGKLLHGYTARPIERDIDYFAPAIEDSFSKSSTFMNNILLVSYGEDSYVRLENTKLTVTDGNSETVTILENPSEVARSIEKLFGISKKFTLEVLAAIGELGEFRG